MHRSVLPPSWLIVAACLLTGCRIGVPIHVWEPPALESAVGTRVVVSDVAGPSPLSGEVRQKLFALAPRDTGRRIALVDYQHLRNETGVKLVSATDEQVNDLAVAAVARRQGAQFLLRGEVIESRSTDHNEAFHDALTISWRLTSLEDGNAGGGFPVSIDTQTAIERYPDLALSNSRDEVLSTAVVRETFRLMTPSIRRDRVQVEVAYLMPGSREVRRGVAAALAGRWGEAEQIWSAVLEQHPFQVPALHNLALAAAAGQDFSRARQLARRAIRLHPSDLHKQSLVWIETRQRAYHRAFGLPDPPEGWFITAETPVVELPR
jgi:hypothetical protein